MDSRKKQNHSSCEKFKVGVGILKWTDFTKGLGKAYRNAKEELN